VIENWRAFCAAREKFLRICGEIARELPELEAAQQHLADTREGGTYKVETPVVYNSALDDVTPDDAVKLILVADNPGRREQSAQWRRFLVGPSGKLAESFFKRETSLAIDFRKNVLILNKTPVHTPRTVELKKLAGLLDDNFKRVLEDSQKKMAGLLADFYAALKVPIWIIGYSEMKKRAVFEAYTDELKNLMRSGKIAENDVMLFRHFSMNQFTIDLGKRRYQGESTGKALERIGSAYRARILGQR
jgi:hypothetical protein